MPYRLTAALVVLTGGLVFQAADVPYAVGPASPGLAAQTRGAGRAPAPSARTADGRPNLEGIWQAQGTADVDLEDHVARHGRRAGRSVVDGGTIPYQPAVLAKKRENAARGDMADPLAQCYMPGVPRIMYMPFAFQVFQARNHVAMTFEWSQVFRLIYTDGSAHHQGIDFWMADSRGRWDGDALVVDVRNHNDKTWFDMAGNFHSADLHLVERYTMPDVNTIRYQVTVEDPKVFTRPWSLAVPLARQVGMARLLEYQCQAEKEEANGAFERDPKTWYPGPAGSTTSGGRER